MAALSKTIADFRRNLSELAARENEASTRDLPEVVYHYTDYRGLKGILTSRCFWIMHYRSMNDPSEVSHGYQAVKAAVERYAQSSDASHKEFWDKFAARFLRSAEMFCHYVLAFCESADYLPAWRWYGDDGAGFAIGVKKNYFTSIKDLKIPLVIGRVTYDEEAFSRNLLPYFHLITSLLYSWQGSPASSREGEEALAALEGAAAPYLLAEALCHKNEQYREEREWRIVATHFIGKKYDIGWKDGKDAKFAGSIPYVISPALADEQVAQILAGPRCNLDHVRWELHRKGLEIFAGRTQASQIPYKNRVFYEYEI